ncbi:hypothetical protein Clopa_2158 [Clostridium pasteurianum BC1]|uniref:Uncharacterized protein n=1 Tax=Clostridium pasteurianum BC1 TaxID=86416 RepID=R4K5S5_CLOPA|nr:hypothetical protein Clopa_2158 [Clostridium pasteurianum BC1]
MDFMMLFCYEIYLNFENKCFYYLKTLNMREGFLIDYVEI